MSESSLAARAREQGADAAQVELVEEISHDWHVHLLYCDFRRDADGCFELALDSSLDTYEHDYSDEDEQQEDRAVAECIRAAGAEVVSMDGAGWEGWSEYTPDPGDTRRVKVRIADPTKEER